MGAVRAVQEDGNFMGELSRAENKLVVVDFTATWCGPCQRMAPKFEQLSLQYPEVVFLKVDVDKCPLTAAGQDVRAMPTFIFYRNRTKLDSCQGADPATLETKIKAHLAPGDGEEREGSVSGHIDLSNYILKDQCECLNESNDKNFKNCLTPDGGFLESDCDEQLIISIHFTQRVKIHSLKIKAPADKGPKCLRLFINQPVTLDFDEATINICVQEIELTPQDCEEGKPVELRFVKFQSVDNLQIFVKNNQTDQEITQIDHLAIIGSPINAMNMSEFKRVAGKKGESH